MTEKEPTNRNKLDIRIHHLGAWGDFLSEYYIAVGEKPWHLGAEDHIKGREFVEMFVKNEVKNDKAVRNFLLISSIDNPQVEDDYTYVCDLVGTTEEEHQKVLSGRTNYYLSFFEEAKTNKNSKFFLTTHLDNYCNSCAVGDHCREIVPIEKNYDLIYSKALNEVFKTTKGNSYVEQRMFGISDDGRMFLTAELLFEVDFYNLLKREVAKLEDQYNLS